MNKPLSAFLVSEGPAGPIQFKRIESHCPSHCLQDNEYSPPVTGSAIDSTKAVSKAVVLFIVWCSKAMSSFRLGRV